MVHEVDLIYVPAHSLPPMALIQSDLWGVLQYLQESENKTEIMRREGRDSPLLELLVGVKKYFAKVIVVDANKSNWIRKRERHAEKIMSSWTLFKRASFMTNHRRSSTESREKHCSLRVTLITKNLTLKPVKDAEVEVMRKRQGFYECCSALWGSGSCEETMCPPFLMLIITDQAGIPVWFNTKRKHTKNQALKEKKIRCTHKSQKLIKLLYRVCCFDFLWKFA